VLSPNDALLLAALVTDGGTSDLDGLISTVDYLDRSSLTFDEVRYGLARLRAGGWVVVEGDGSSPRVSVTGRSTELANRIGQGVGMIDFRFVLADALDATAPEEDRSLGPLPELDRAAFEAAMARHTGRVPPEVMAWANGISAQWSGSGEQYAPFVEMSRRARRRMRRDGAQ